MRKGFVLDLKQIGKPSEKFRDVSIMNSHMFMELISLRGGFDYHQVLEKKVALSQLNLLALVLN